MLRPAEADRTKLLSRAGPIRASYSRELVQVPLNVGCAEELGLLHYAGGDTYACRHTQGGSETLGQGCCWPGYLELEGGDSKRQAGDDGKKSMEREKCVGEGRPVRIATGAAGDGEALQHIATAHSQLEQRVFARPGRS